MKNTNENAIVKSWSTTVATIITKEVPTAVANGLVISGKRGVTNAQMIPALRKFIETNDKASLEILAQQFPSVYHSSTNYLSKDQKSKLAALELA